MDIFKWAEDYNYGADYMDPNTGYVYHLQEYGKLMKSGLPYEKKVKVTCGGKLIGYVEDNR